MPRHKGGARAASPVKPSAGRHAYDDIPVARPVGYDHTAPSSTAQSADFTSGGFLPNAVRLCVFHFVNLANSIAAFVAISVGSLVSFVLLPLCCLGVSTFRVVLLLVSYFAESDVKLYNYISPPNEQVYLSMPRQSNLFQFVGFQIVPNLKSLSHGALLVALYFCTVKFVIALLSVFALTVVIAFPVAGFTYESVRTTFFSGFFGIAGFVMISSLLLILGVAIMKFSANLSRAATRHFCCQKFSVYQYAERVNAYPAAVATYGTTQHGDKDVITLAA